MKPTQLTRLALAATLALAPIGAAHADDGTADASAAPRKANTCVKENYTPDQYEVYIDAPTGFAFIKTPCGWKFIRRIDPERLTEAAALARR